MNRRTFLALAGTASSSALLGARLVNASDEEMSVQLDRAAIGQPQSVRDDWAEMKVIPATGANRVVFTSGFGDGYYASYWGLDEQDAPVCTVTDFHVVH